MVTFCVQSLAKYNFFRNNTLFLKKLYLAFACEVQCGDLRTARITVA